MGTRKRSVTVFLVCWMIFTWCIALPRTTAQTAEPDFDYPSDPGFIVLEYMQRHAMLQEPTTVLRLYGDGHVRVHYPQGMTRAGDYDLLLTGGEVRKLLGTLVANGVFDFEPREVARLRREAEAERSQREGTLFAVSDDTYTEITVRLNRYTPPGGGASIGDFAKTVTWSNVNVDARMYPSVNALQGLAAAEQELRALLERDDLLVRK